MAEVKKKHHFQYIYTLALDNDGKELSESKVREPQDTKYEFYDSFIIRQESAFPTYHILARTSKNITYASEGNKDIEITLSSLEKYSLERFTFRNGIGNYQIHTVLLKNILADFVTQNQISRFGSIKFRRNNGQIFLYGDACAINDNWSGYPFIITLSDQLEVLNSRIYNQDKYMYTDIENIGINKDNTIIIEGTKHDAIDGWYYSTNMKFIVDQELNILEDLSDNKPYYSFYRGPSAPDYEEDGADNIENTAETSNETETIAESKSELQAPVENNSIEELFYAENPYRKTYYSFTYDKEDIKDIVLGKWNKSDSTLILKRTFALSNEYYPLTLHETSDGGFIAAFAQRNRLKSGESYQKDYCKSKAILFRFNKQGNLSHQYETSFLLGSTNNLYLHNAKDKLIVVYTTNNSYFDGQGWHYPLQLSIVAFPYK